MAVNWRLAKALERLRSEVNAAVPGRDKSSDGSIGDAEHASRSSDHNPWVMDGKMGVVTAIDITHNPARGLDAHALAEKLRLSGDGRLKYIISNRRIASYDKENWKWRPYSGKNPHDHHCHISVRSAKTLYDDASPWGIDTDNTVPIPIEHRPPEVAKDPVLAKGSKGDAVEALQKLLGFKDKDVDGDFGGKTFDAVKSFQRKSKLVVDGRVGPATWAALRK